MNRPFKVFTSDLDGDGDEDILSASFSGEVIWFENTDGQPPFSDGRVITSSGDQVQSVFTADLDGDGRQDILSASSEQIAWYEQSISFGSPLSRSAPVT